MSSNAPTATDQEDAIRVLHVDDDRAFADMTETFLEREDDRYTVEVETNARDGLDHLGGAGIDCVVSDYDMPRMNGIEFLERVREEYPDLPFILFTGKGSEAVASEAISAGVSDYLQKAGGSEQYELLCNRIENIVEKRRAERNYRELFEKVQVGLTTHDPETGVITDANRTFEEFLGYDRDELIGRHPGALSPDDSPFTREEADRLLEKTLADGPQRFEWRDKTKDGESRCVEVNLKPTVINGQKQVLAIVQDITERKEHQQAVERAKQKFETVFETSNDAILILDADSETIIDCNPAATDFLGYSREELLSMAPRDLHPHNLPEFMEFAETVMETGSGWTDELTCYGKDDEPIPSEISAAVCEIDGRPCLVSSIRDISERKERERALETTEQLFEAVFNNPVTLMGVLEPDGTVRRLNETALEFMDASHDDVVDRRFQDLPVWSHSSTVRSDLVGWLDRAADGEFVRFEAENRAADGEIVTIDGILQPVFDDDSVTRVVAAGRDIEDRKAHERELEATASYLETVLETVPSAVFLADRDDRVVLMSEFGKEFLGLENEVVEGRRLRDFASDTVPSEILDQIEEMHRETIADERRIEAELEFPTPDGPRTVRAITAPYYAGSDEPAGICGVAVDITEQKAREAELASINERLDAFASVVSHDLRNPLNVAKGRVELEMQDTDSENLETAKDSLERMESLIEDVLSLARDGDDIDDIGPVEVDAVAQRCWENVSTRAASLEVDAIGRIHADESRLQQLFENLYRNAVDHGGEGVSIRVEPIEGGFAVEDDGPGIPEEARDRVFENGYSTDGLGTGFGLSIVTQVADAHGWEIRVTDGAAGGARIEVTGVEFDAG